MRDRWYRDGLRFRCTQCGDCCTGAPGYVWVTRKEVERLAGYLNISIGEFRERYLRKMGRRYSLIERGNGDCVFYKEGCTVYPARPGQCRTYPFWPESLKSRTAWERTCEECPGAGKGRFYTAEEIERIRRGEGEAR